MRIDDECRDPELLAAEVRRLQSVIAAGEPTLTDAEREAIETAVRWLEPYPQCAATLRNLLERMK
jgi:hypothetical protein